MREPDEFFERFDLTTFGLYDDLRLGNLLVLLEFINSSEAKLDFVMNVFRHQRHFLNDLLLVVKLRERALKLVVQFLEGALNSAAFGLCRRRVPRRIFLIHLLVNEANVLYESAQIAQMEIAAINFLVEDDP